MARGRRLLSSPDRTDAATICENDTAAYLAQLPDVSISFAFAAYGVSLSVDFGIRSARFVNSIAPVEQHAATFSGT